MCPKLVNFLAFPLVSTAIPPVAQARNLGVFTLDWIGYRSWIQGLDIGVSPSLPYPSLQHVLLGTPKQNI